MTQNKNTDKTESQELINSNKYNTLPALRNKRSLFMLTNSIINSAMAYRKTNQLINE